jgi:threonine-phosphate decarboxylase
MTKKYCIPGIRLGYVTAHRDIIAHLRMLKQPWSVNALALEAGKFLLQNDIHVLPDMHHLLDETQKFREQIDHIKDFKTYPTDTNFFLIEHTNHAHTSTEVTLKNYLATHGILVRDCSNFKKLSSHFIRVATQLPKENKELIKWFKQYPY